MRARSRAPLLPLAALAVLAAGFGCASYELVALPHRDADVYPTAHEERRVVVAVDAMDDARRVERYFGADLTAAGILPVLVVVSNHGERRLEVSPADLLLLEGRDVVDPLPLEHVLRVPKERALFLRDETAAKLESFYGGLAFREVVVAPGESYQGVLFFDVGRAERPQNRFDRYFRIARLFPEPALRLHVGATALESGERLRFGPFRVEAGRERAL